jgi:serine phosphatase RsbU (regulator of sigma subunit)/pSer/pThr/pTyr-binding forkhead associated (FHA) protein
MANLLVLTGARRGQTLPLQEHKTVLGRDPGCDVVINAAMLSHDTAGRTGSVSRRHAVISCVGDAYYIEDGDGQGSASRNGTFVNDHKVPFPGRLLLRDNDLIRICNFGCTYHTEGEATFTVEASLDHTSSVESLQTQSAEKLRIILEISNSLSSTLDSDALLHRLLDGLFQIFKQAHRGFIILCDEASGPLDLQVFQTRRPADGADARFSSSIVRRCLANREAILGNDLTQQFPESDSAVKLPANSLMCAPLWSQDGRPLGAIQLDAQEPEPKFTEEDLKLLVGVASQASVALCNARLHRDALVHQRRERELEIAHHVQRSLLPQHLPDVPGYQFYAYYQAAEQVGGDYYDFIPLPGQRLAVLLGDVAGKSVPAALLMAKFSVEARVCLETQPDPAAAVGKLNALMLRATAPDRFVTLVAVVLDPAAHTATLVNAGHPSPLRFRSSADGVEEAAPVEVAGVPIGIAEGYRYTACELQFLPGDALLLFSDGVTDAADARGARFGISGIRAVLASGRLPPQDAGERLIQALKRHAFGCSQIDDITVVCFGRAAP